MKNLILKLFTIIIVFSTANIFSNSPVFIEWEMDKYFGLDENNDGRIDIPNSKEYVNPNGYGISFSLKNYSKNDANFIWELKDSAGKLHIKETSLPNVHFSDIPSGKALISCSFDNVKIEEIIHPKNYLIAAIGDSYASGEGTPETIYSKTRPSVWADGGPGSTESINHLRAHRSSLAWGPQTALFLENYDPHSSITFVFLAASGAKIREGILEEYSGVENPFKIDDMPPQIDQLEEICDGREIDQLYISVGGNDIGFVRIAMHLAVFKKSKKGYTDRYQRKHNRLLNCVETGKFNTALGILLGNSLSHLPGLNNLDKEYEKLEEELSKRLKIKETYLIAYPSPVVPNIRVLDDFFPKLGFVINEDDTNFLIEKIYKPLEEIKKATSEKLGWNYVPLEISKFENHHLALEQPYEADSYAEFINNKMPIPWNKFQEHINIKTRWFRTAPESVIVQGAGPDKKNPSNFSTKGTIHPNDLGNQAIMHELLYSMNLLPGYPDYKGIYRE